MSRIIKPEEGQALYLGDKKGESIREVGVKLVVDENALELGEIKIEAAVEGFVRFDFEVDWALTENDGEPLPST